MIRQFTSRHLITSSEPQSSLNSLNMDNNSLSQSMDSVNTAVSVTGEEEVRKAFKYHVSDRNFSREFARIFCQVLYCSSVVKSPPQFLPSAAANIGFETDKLRKERVQSNSQLQLDEILNSRIILSDECMYRILISTGSMAAQRLSSLICVRKLIH